MLTMGEKVAELEAGLAAACEVEHAVAVSSGTAALHLAVLALGIGPGDEVVVPAYTFPATANVVALAGATPVLVDVDPATNNIDPAKVEVTPRTKAIMPVHLFGRPARLEELPDLPLIEDAAGALGARRRGRACGGLGALGCLSFHPRKIVTTGEGGAVTTNDADLAERVRSLRHHGWSPSNALRRHAGGRASTTGSRTSSAPSGSRSSLASRSSSQRASASPRGMPSAWATSPSSCLVWTRATATAGRPTSSSSTGGTRRWPRLRAQGIQCQIGTYALHRLGAYRDQGSFPGADACFERCSRAPAAHEADRRRARPRRRQAGCGPLARAASPAAMRGRRRARPRAQPPSGRRGCGCAARGSRGGRRASPPPRRARAPPGGRSRRAGRTTRGSAGGCRRSRSGHGGSGRAARGASRASARSAGTRRSRSGGTGSGASPSGRSRPRAPDSTALPTMFASIIAVVFAPTTAVQWASVS